ncbi:elongation factor P maturation arginine rhamnosyltransferase EarP [Bordetella bronchialis]|uniref:Protein-arginine rhamnosyltransferase n=1 Tax=Bordetella bronchialis TaxID=463025 RepID=A0A193FGE8_9BORD|nr:elongation factor P maturation arginine rhamnosyltransferase EarP [Bordetella bronchialis]ANN66184.1 hypothetical protein BAU06_07670 [Bordetella bronchialis]ANN71266.1 hypothetical protein BAU08_07900 [Bordetella bronchialis]
MHADIFCRRVDNYGDIGVCWRLARGLKQAAGWRIRLWIDDLPAFARMEPRCALDRQIQDIDGVAIVAWTSPAPALTPGDVVIEAFACDPPDAFRAAMRQRAAAAAPEPAAPEPAAPEPAAPIWINLEYLSAEPWVESHHRLPSPQPDGLMKYFFFPGFTAATGGLLREPDLAARRDAFQRSPDAQRAFLQGLGIGADRMAGWLPACGGAHPASTRLATLFCYPTAPLASLVAALSGDPRPTLLLVPEGVAPGLEALAGPAATGLDIVRIPFLSQDDYDRLLWCADLNFVRGEDSVVRAGWAGRPLVWQIYPQADDIHLDKLHAWLDRYRPPPQARALILAWNTGAASGPLAAAWRDATSAPGWEAWRHTARAWDRDLSAMPDLAANLIRFCANLRQKC